MTQTVIESGRQTEQTEKAKKYPDDWTSEQVLNTRLTPTPTGSATQRANSWPESSTADWLTSALPRGARSSARRRKRLICWLAWRWFLKHQRVITIHGQQSDAIAPTNTRKTRWTAEVTVGRKGRREWATELCCQTTGTAVLLSWSSLPLVSELDVSVSVVAGSSAGYLVEPTYLVW